MQGQLNFFHGTTPLKINKPIRLVEMFSGIGAQAKALENLGCNFETYRICEFDPHAVRSYNAVHHTDFQPSDITKITADDLNICDTDKFFYIFTYSFPCQDLSVAGLGKGMERGSGTRSGLLFEVERLLNEIDENPKYALPQVLVMENVPGVIGEKNRKPFEEWLLALEKLGYTSTYQILNAKDYGIPQNRERCFMVSWQGDYSYEFPEPIPLKFRLKDFIEDEVDEKYYLSAETTNKFLENTDEHTLQVLKANS